MLSSSNKLGNTTSVIVDNAAERAGRGYVRAVAAVRRLSVHRTSATRIIAAFVVVSCGLWATRATYYVRTDPRIEPGSGVIALSPWTTVRPHTYNFTLSLLDYKAVATAVSSGWWARLRSGYDRDAPTQAASVTVRALGPGIACRVFHLAPGEAGVYRSGDARIEFRGMYSGRARVRIDRDSPTYTSQITIQTGSISAVAGTDVIIGVGSVLAPGQIEETAVADPLKMVYTASTRNTAEPPVTRSAVPGSSFRLGQVVGQVIHLKPNEVTFSTGNDPPTRTVNEGCDCDGGCAAAQSAASTDLSRSPAFR